MYDYQEGRGIMEVEKPQLKIKMTGVYHVLFICRGRETSIIGGGGGHIFIYSCYAQLISFEIEIKILKSIVFYSL